MKKYIHQLTRKRISKTALASILIGTFTLSTTQAYANDTTIQTGQEVETVEIQANNTTITTNEGKMNTTQTNEAPSLVPGDFFYFLKVTIEKIKLFLTIDDVAEAELLAKFASERLAEAEVLLAEGEDKQASEILKKAIEDMDLAGNVVEAPKKEEELPQQPAAEVITTEVTPTENKIENQTEAAQSQAAAPTNENAEQVEEILAQNIIALTAAMEKVKNPVAKAALQKNIEKSLAKLDKRLSKVEVPVTKELTIEASIETEMIEVKAEAPVDSEITKDLVDTAEAVTSKKEIKDQEKKAIKTLKEDHKKQKKELKNEWKEKQKNLKNEKKTNKQNHNIPKENRGKSNKKQDSKK
jgi:hypothetical protein